MKYIKNKRAFATGVITAAGALLCLGALAVQGMQMRFVIALLLFAAWSAVSWFAAFTRKGAAEQAAEYADERDRYLAQRSGHVALLITSYLLYGACMLALVLYGIYRYTVFITVAVTLCGALLAMLAVFLGANLWFERHG